MKILLLPFITLSLVAQEPSREKNALDKVELPGVTVNVKENAVDVASMICLNEGPLEFIACTKNTKEHESLIRTEAKPSHIHAALLLIGAKAGHPAIRKMVGEEEQARFIDLPPKGSPIGVSLVITGKDGKKTERLISDFVARINYDEETEEPKIESTAEEFKTFLFAGSHLHGPEGQPKVYLADNSGSVISLSTFGDELLCLPGVHAKVNQALQWEVNPKHVPKVESKVLLRLRPLKEKGNADK